jgi:putative PIN family toxin of toxin-antitoxin system
MIITVDTNVIYSGLYSKLGASNGILQLILKEEVKLALSPQTYFEYYDVLTREENLKMLSLTISEVEDILDLLAALSQKHSIYFLLKPNLIEEKDNIFMECAFSSNSDYLITSNVKDFKGGELKGFRFKIVTPREFYKEWRRSHE